MRCICISKKSADYVLASSFLLIACDYCYSYMSVRPELFLRHSENNFARARNVCVNKNKPGNFSVQGYRMRTRFTRARP